MLLFSGGYRIHAYLSDCEADEFSSRPQMCVVAGNDTEHQRTDQEALYLDPTTTEDFNKVDGEEVSRHVASGSDDEISVSVLQKRIILGFAFGEADGGQKHGLIEIETVEGDIDKKPA